MNHLNLALKLLCLSLLLSCNPALAETAEDDCQPSGDYGFVCGLQSAEDLVRVPGTSWIIASGFGPGAPIYLVNAQDKTWSALYPSENSGSRQDMALYGACPGAPDPAQFVTHGLNLRPGADGHSTLYVVGHGGREAIEVFDVDASGTEPVLTWTGCILLEDGLVANSVASFDDGSLVMTVPLLPGTTISDALAALPTGAVFKWSPGDEGLTRIAGTELPYGNGIEVSADGSEFYVASSGLLNVIAFSNTNPSRALRTTQTLAIVPDNLHWGPDGRLLTAGLVADDPDCGNVRGPGTFDLDEYAACPRPFIVSAIDPRTMADEVLARGPANPRFSNITMALPVGNQLWIGTFAGDRIAYGPFNPPD